MLTTCRSFTYLSSLKKLLSLKLFSDETGNFWKKSLVELDLELLLVSQFTLYANIEKGTKPDFHNSMKSEESRPFFDKFVEMCRKSYKPERIQSKRPNSK